MVLSAQGLTKEFRGFRAVDDVDLDVSEGSVHALVGLNGAGKTTLFNLLTGFVKPTKGRISLGDRELSGRPPEQIVRLGVARSFQITSLFPQLTAREHVELALQGGTSLGWRFWRSERKMARFRDRARELLDQVRLGDLQDTHAGALSYGHKRALELALALALDPKVLLLDEPTAGMGVEDVSATVDLIGRVRDGRTVVLVEHNMNVVATLADREQDRAGCPQRPVRRVRRPVRKEQRRGGQDGDRRLQGQVRRQGRGQEDRGRFRRPPEQAGDRQLQGAGAVRPAGRGHHP